MPKKRDTGAPLTASPDDKFDVLFARTQLSRADLMGRWAESGLEWESWIDLELAQIKEIEAGLAETDAGEFASPWEVEAIFAQTGSLDAEIGQGGNPSRRFSTLSTRFENMPSSTSRACRRNIAPSRWSGQLDRRSWPSPRASSTNYATGSRSRS